jgi:hypothetical protein
MPNKQHRYKEAHRDFERAGLTLAPSRYWFLESTLNQFKVEFIYPYFSYLMGNIVNVKSIFPYKTEQVLDEKFSSKLDKQGNKRSNGREVNPKETMATLLRLQVLPNDHKATLDAYLRKLGGHIEDLKDVLGSRDRLATSPYPPSAKKRFRALARFVLPATIPNILPGILSNFIIENKNATSIFILVLKLAIFQWEARGGGVGGCNYIMVQLSC